MHQRLSRTEACIPLTLREIKIQYTMVQVQPPGQTVTQIFALSPGQSLKKDLEGRLHRASNNQNLNSIIDLVVCFQNTSYLYIFLQLFMSAGYSSESQCRYISADTLCHYSCKQWHFFRRERKMHSFSNTCPRLKQLRLRKISFFFHGVPVKCHQQWLPLLMTQHVQYLKYPWKLCFQGSKSPQCS